MYVVLIFCVEFQELSRLTRDISQTEKKINVVTSWANAQNDIHLFHSKWSKLLFWGKIHVIFSVAELVTTFIFSAWDKSRVKWDNSWNSTQKMRNKTIFCQDINSVYKLDSTCRIKIENSSDILRYIFGSP